MPIRLEIIGNDPQEFAVNLAGTISMISGRAVAAPVNTVAEAPVEPEVKPKRGRPAKPADKAAESVTVEPAKTEEVVETVTETPAETPSEKVVEKTEGPSLAEVKAAFIALLNAKGEGVPPTILAQFNVKKLSELKAEDYAKAIAAATEAAA